MERRSTAGETREQQQIFNHRSIYIKCASHPNKLVCATRTEFTCKIKLEWYLVRFRLWFFCRGKGSSAFSLLLLAFILYKHDTSPSPHKLFSPFPNHHHHWWISRLLYKTIHIAGTNRNRVTSKYGLVIALPEEVSVNDRREQRILERNRAEKDSNEDDKFGKGDNSHCRVIIG